MNQIVIYTIVQANYLKYFLPKKLYLLSMRNQPETRKCMHTQVRGKRLHVRYVIWNRRLYQSDFEVINDGWFIIS